MKNALAMKYLEDEYLDDEYMDDEKRDASVLKILTGEKEKEKKPAKSNADVSVNKIREILKQMKVSVTLNLTTGKMEIEGMPVEYSKAEAPNILPVLVRDFLAEKGIKAGRNRIIECLHVIADYNRYNPVIEMITDTVYDGEDRIDVIFSILGLQPDSEDSEQVAEIKARYRKYVTKWLHQCVAMALNDDEEPYGADGVLVLQGEQGLGKTLFFRTIAVEPLWFGEGINMDMSKKDSKILATGKWIAELGELESTLGRKQSDLKAFLTARSDEIRLPYARTAVNRPRHTSFCGTVNPERFLTDETGNRRYWVVRVKRIDLDKLLSLDREWLYQLWAQVYQELYLPDPDGFRMNSAEVKQLNIDNMEFMVPISGELEIIERLCWDAPQEEWRYAKMSDLARSVGGMNAAQAGKVITRLQKRDRRILDRKTHNNNKQYFLPPVHSNEQAKNAVGVAADDA